MVATQILGQIQDKDCISLEEMRVEEIKGVGTLHRNYAYLSKRHCIQNIPDLTKALDFQNHHEKIDGQSSCSFAFYI